MMRQAAGAALETNITPRRDLAMIAIQGPRARSKVWLHSAALRTATVNAADLLGKTDRGVIAAGKLADLVAVDGNPLENISATERVQFVMLGGRVVREPARTPLP